MNKWKRRARKWQARYNALFVPKPSETCLRCGHVYEEHSDSICMVEDCECDCFDWSRVSRLCRKSCKREADELRQDVLRSATELARVQGECDKWKSAAESCDRDYTTQMYRDNALLAWQREVREAWAAYDAEDEVEASTLDRLRRAIESEPVEPKGEP